ncbi:MAG: FAD-dependent oxidoreductase [Coriobacteriaceae bacterium]|nr:FAD-dependent oxidoreductase [Coriobacteriaceae bacterium]
MENKADMTRRAFLGAGAMGMAGAVCLSGRANAETTGWDVEADVVVVGLGGAGAAAAVAAGEAGASVCVIEKGARGGGSTMRSGGIVYMGGTELQRHFGVKDSVENMHAYISAFVGSHADADLVRTFCEESPSLYDWLVAHGVSFEGDLDDWSHSTEPQPGVVLMYSGNERAFEYCNVAEPAPRGHAPTDRGAGIFEPLEAETEGFASVHYGTSGKELVVEDGRVVGVVASTEDGGELRIAARKGVVITAGAFTMNDAMLADYVSDTLTCGSRTGCENDLGEGILMGQRIGAATRTMGRVNYNRSIYLYGDLAAGALLDYNGRRFVAEDAHGGLVGRSIATHSPDKGFIFIDQPKLEAAAATPYGQYLKPAAQADTVEELAEIVGLPVGNVTDAIERYNGYCAAGYDPECHKSADFLKPIDTPPYYAVNGAQSSCGFHTLGGLKINARAEVVNLDGEVIPGLYAAGRSSCGFFGVYPGSGCSIGDGLTFGRIAGREAAAR